MLILAFVTSIVALAYGAVLYQKVLAAPRCTERANDIATSIAEGASAFLSRQYRTVAIVGAPILFVIWFLDDLGNWYAFGFLVGALASAGAGFVGMNVSVRANVRTAEAAL